MASASEESRINLLTELHRPLEDHWKNSKEVNAIGSDNLYKHHVTRLRDIYVNHQFAVGSIPQMGNTTPLTQLFGTKGLAVKHDENTLKKREMEFNLRMSNDKPESRHSNNSSRKSGQAATSSPSPNHRAHSSSVNDNHHSNGVSTNSSNRVRSARRSGRKEEEADKSNTRYNDNTNNYGTNSNEDERHRCTKKGIDPEDLTIIGQYVLSEQQMDIYWRFTEMLQQFDEYDMRNILDDVRKDAVSSSLIRDYGGTS